MAGPRGGFASSGSVLGSRQQGIGPTCRRQTKWTEETMLARLGLIAAVTLSMLLPVAEPAAAQKQGGTLRIYHRDNPPSASLHEEATISTVMPFMARVQQPRAVRPDQAAEQPRDDRARPGRRAGLGRQQDQADLQAAPRA